MLNMQKIMAMKKIKVEFDDLNSNPLSNIGYSIQLSAEDNIFEWDITLLGAPDSIYAGGIFHIKVIFPDDFPYKAPQLYFLTPIYHLDVNPRKIDSPGVEHLGHLSVSFINWWKPDITIKEILTKLYAVFYLQTPETPYGLERAEEFRFNRPLYNIKAKYFTKKYATKENFWKEEKFDKDWDFSYNENDIKNHKPEINQVRISKGKEKGIDGENINLIFEINGIKRKTITFQKKEITKNVIQKVIEDFGFKTENNIIFIYDKRKLISDIPIIDNGLVDNSIITIIYDVIYA